jgi:hypothetical protein
MLVPISQLALPRDLRTLRAHARKGKVSRELIICIRRWEGAVR